MIGTEPSHPHHHQFSALLERVSFIYIYYCWGIQLCLEIYTIYKSQPTYFVFCNKAKNITMVCSPINIWDKSVKGFIKMFISLNVLIFQTAVIFLNLKWRN